MNALLLVLLLHAAVLYADDLSFHGAPSADDLAKYLSRKNSALAGEASVLVSEGQKWDVDPRLTAAIAGAETTFGKRVCATNNTWNWFHHRTCPPSTFDTWDQGIQTVSKFLQRSYFRKGYTTVPLIREKYCASGCDNWVRLVTAFRAEMPAGQTPPQPAPANPVPVSSAGSTGSGQGMRMPLIFFAAAALLCGYLFRLIRRTR